MTAAIVFSARNAAIFLPFSIVFSDGIRLTPLMVALPALIRSGMPHAVQIVDGDERRDVVVVVQPFHLLVDAERALLELLDLVVVVVLGDGVGARVGAAAFHFALSASTTSWIGLMLPPLSPSSTMSLKPCVFRLTAMSVSTAR